MSFWNASGIERFSWTRYKNRALRASFIWFRFARLTSIYWRILIYKTGICRLTFKSDKCQCNKLYLSVPDLNFPNKDMNFPSKLSFFCLALGDKTDFSHAGLMSLPNRVGDITLNGFSSSSFHSKSIIQLHTATSLGGQDEGIGSGSCPVETDGPACSMSPDGPGCELNMSIWLIVQ